MRRKLSQIGHQHSPREPQMEPSIDMKNGSRIFRIGYLDMEDKNIKASGRSKLTCKDKTVVEVLFGQKCTEKLNLPDTTILRTAQR